MGYKVGNILPRKVFVGNTLASKIYKGDGLEWERKSLGGYSFVQSNNAEVGVDVIRGKSLVWNQLVENGNFANGKTRWQLVNGSAEVNSGVLTFTCTSANTNSSIRQNSDSKYKNTHKFLVSVMVKPSATRRVSVYLSGNWVNAQDVPANNWYNIKSIVTGTGSNGEFGVYPFTNEPAINDTCDIKNINVINLTLMFGKGKEPSTVEEFERLYNLPYYQNNSGTIINNVINSLELTGFNQWDEEWESGSYNLDTGEKYENATYFRSKNTIKVLPNTQYCFKKTAEQSARFLQYDENGNYLGYLSPATANAKSVLTTHQQAHYATFYANVDYNKNICINLSDASLNGTYKPYKKETVNINLTTLTGKLSGTGESVLVYPNGAKSAGNTYDYLLVDTDGWARTAVKTIGTKVMDGSETWALYNNTSYPGLLYSDSAITDNKIGADIMDMTCSHFVTTNESSPSINTTRFQRESNKDTVLSHRIYFRYKTTAVTVQEWTDWLTEQYSAGTPVVVNYPLATPETYTLDSPIYLGYEVEQGGVTRVLPENTSTPTNAPLSMDVAESVIRGLHFQRIEYLESDGNQYVDTGIYADNTTKTELGFQLVSNSISKAIYGSYNEHIGSYYMYTSASSVWQIGFNDYINTSDKRIDTNYHDVVFDDFKVTMDGVILNEFVKNPFVDSRTLFIFNINRSSGVLYAGAPMKLHYLRIYQSNVLVRDLIPVRVGQVGYMYDKVSGQLFGNSGSGSFILGPDILDIQQVEYLESDGNQWIDTGLIPRQNLPFECKFYNDGDNTPGYGNVFGSRVASNNNEYQLTQFAGGTIGVGYRNSGLFSKSQIHTISYDGVNKVNIDENQHTITAGTISTTNSIVLFGIKQGDNVVTQLQAGKIYKCSFGNEIDLIPVRVGQTGYMYDTISKRLFGNSGTGNFILGPDMN